MHIVSLNQVVFVQKTDTELFITKQEKKMVISKKECGIAAKTMAAVTVVALIIALVGYLTASPAVNFIGLFFAAIAGMRALSFIIAYRLAKE
jgi:hypothetical protein